MPKPPKRIEIKPGALPNNGPAPKIDYNADHPPPIMWPAGKLTGQLAQVRAVLNSMWEDEWKVFKALRSLQENQLFFFKVLERHGLIVGTKKEDGSVRWTDAQVETEPEPEMPSES